MRDVMMHMRPPSARTGGAGRLMTPEQYTQAVGGFPSFSFGLLSVLLLRSAAGCRWLMSAHVTPLFLLRGLVCRLWVWPGVLSLLFVSPEPSPWQIQLNGFRLIQVLWLRAVTSNHHLCHRRYHSPVLYCLYCLHRTAQFGDTMESYSSRLRGVLSTMKEGLKLDIAEAAQQASFERVSELCMRYPSKVRLHLHIDVWLAMFQS